MQTEPINKVTNDQKDKALVLLGSLTDKKRLVFLGLRGEIHLDPVDNWKLCEPEKSESLLRA